MKSSKASILRDIEDINRLIRVVGVLTRVREAACGASDSVTVSDGGHFDKNFDVVVSCPVKDRDYVGRRISSGVSGVKVEMLADNLIGVRMA